MKPLLSEDFLRKSPTARTLYHESAERMPYVLAAPHMAAHTGEAANAMGWMSLEACPAVLRGEHPPHAVNPDVVDSDR